MFETTYDSCLKKQAQMKNLFAGCKTTEEKYQKIIELGKTLPRFEDDYKTKANIVQGCQSILYLSSRLENGKIFFKVDSEALISAGLAALLIGIYNGESPETVIKCPPLFIQELGLQDALSPSRSNGLASMYLRMKQDSLRLITDLL